MTYVASDGPPDVDASHAWAPASGSTPPVINNWTVDPITLPYVALEHINGWRDSPEADDFREPRTAGEGELAYPGMLLGKTLVYEGVIAASTRESLAGRTTALLNGFGDRSGLGTMTVTPFTAIGGVVWQYQARVLELRPEQIVYDDNPDPIPVLGTAGTWRRGYTLSLRMVDPRFYTPNLAGTGYI